MTAAHLVADEVTLCGIPYRDPRRYPLVGVQHLPAHHAGHGLEPCPVCASVWAGVLLMAVCP